jgi:xanthine dehydrogenase small subunit
MPATGRRRRTTRCLRSRFCSTERRSASEGVSPTRTLLDWLREDRGLTGTKEGCNEGDCGACTVMVTDAGGTRALNACILFLPQLHGKAVRTVEGIAGPDGTLHPVQRR